MPPSFLRHISVTTTAEAEEAVAELLARVFALPSSSYTAQETQLSIVSVFGPATPPVHAAQIAALRTGLAQIQNQGLDIQPGRIRQRKIREQDWAESWKRHFPPIEIKRALLIKPSWSRKRPRAGQAIVVLDPGLSFGTGHHATTAFCLDQIVACRKTGQSSSFLDMGTGSGILAIAAAKLDYHPVDGFDYDRIAVQIARANARRNGVQKRVRFRHYDLTRSAGKDSAAYDLVCANLETPLLLERAPQIRRRLNPGGVLILAGIQANQFDQVARTYTRLGLVLRAARTEKEWRSGAFRFGCRE
jgi:ribosomal protein L11 methyltransferase